MVNSQRELVYGKIRSMDRLNIDMYSGETGITLERYIQPTVMSVCAKSPRFPVT